MCTGWVYQGGTGRHIPRVVGEAYTTLRGTRRGCSGSLSFLPKEAGSLCAEVSLPKEAGSLCAEVSRALLREAGSLCAEASPGSSKGGWKPLRRGLSGSLGKRRFLEKPPPQVSLRPALPDGYPIFISFRVAETDDPARPDIPLLTLLTLLVTSRRPTRAKSIV